MIATLLLQAAQPAAVPAAPASPVSVPAPTPPWTPIERVNAASGIRSVSASATARGGAGRLVVRCDRGAVAVVSIQFIPRDPPAGGALQPVSLAFDGGTPMGDNWELMGAGLIERGDAAATNLSVGIAHAREIKLHMVDAAGSGVDLGFAGPSGEAPIRRVVEACGFTFGQPPARAPAPAAPTP